MALAIIKQTNYGVAATYHKIVRTDINWHTGESIVELHSFLSQTARESGAQPLAAEAFFWNDSDFPFVVDANNVQVAYTKIKSLPEWAGAEDC